MEVARFISPIISSISTEFDEAKEAVSLKFPGAVLCRLEVMIADETITSVGNYFENTFKYAKNQLADDPTWGFADKESFSTFEVVLKRLALGAISMEIGEKVGKDIDRFNVWVARSP